MNAAVLFGAVLVLFAELLLLLVKFEDCLPVHIKFLEKLHNLIGNRVLTVLLIILVVLRLLESIYLVVKLRCLGFSVPKILKYLFLTILLGGYACKLLPLTVTFEERQILQQVYGRPSSSSGSRKNM